MILLLFLFVLCLTLLGFRSRIPDRPAVRGTVVTLVLLLVVWTLAQFFEPQPPRELREALANGKTLRMGEVSQLSEFLAAMTDPGTLVFLADTKVKPGQDIAFQALKRALPSGWLVQYHELRPHTSQVEDMEGKQPVAASIPPLPWDQIDWVVISNRHHDVLQELQVFSRAGKLPRKIVLFARDPREARHWVDNGLTDAAVIYEVPPDLHAPLRGGKTLSDIDVRALFHVYSSLSATDSR